MAHKDVTDLMVCQAYADAKALRHKPSPGHIFGLRALPPTPCPYELLMLRTNECLKVCYQAMERAHKRDLIEYGTSLRSGWLTEKGKALLCAAQQKSEGA
jgi:hypothetical protein